MILDTRFLGALVDGDDAARRTAAELDAAREPTRIPTAVLWEAYTGIEDAASAEMARELRGLYEQLLTSRSTLALTPQVARLAGELNGGSAALDGADSVVAAHGLLLDEPVVSNDPAFRDIERLDIVTY